LRAPAAAAPRDGGRFIQAVAEEIFVLEGSDVFGDVGRMGPGARW
jgi:hypothetical protein